jgi:NADH:ubiquinone oxidoreductase subunit 4 (subunit M)
MHFPVLTALVALPAFGAALLFFVRDEEGKLVRNIAFVV